MLKCSRQPLKSRDNLEIIFSGSSASKKDWGKINVLGNCKPNGKYLGGGVSSLVLLTIHRIKML